MSDNVRSLILSECQSIARRGHVVIVRDTTTFLFTALLIPKNIIVMNCHYGTTLSRCFKDILSAVAEWLAAWTAGCTIGVRIPSRLKYFVLIFLNFFRINLYVCKSVKIMKID